MSLDQPSSIPVDRHVFAFASKWYGIKTTRYEEVAESFRKLWGDWAGWAHSVSTNYSSLPSFGIQEIEKTKQGRVDKAVD